MNAWIRKATPGPSIPTISETGWTRTVRKIDLEATRLSTLEAPIYQTRTLAADAELSDRLTWQASRTSIELALGSPPRGRDPCATLSRTKPKFQQGLMS